MSGKTKIPIGREYINYHNQYTIKYGSKVLVLMMVGGFYEAYCTNDEGPNLESIAQILNIMFKKRADKDNESNDSAPHMMGFPIASLDKYVKVLIENNYTVVIIDQITPPPKPKREVVAIYSPGTYIETNRLSNNFIVSVFLTEEKQHNGAFLYCTGLSSVDLTTGKTYVYETYSKTEDDKYALDEIIRYINIHNPKEIILTHLTYGNISKNDLIAYLELDNKNYYYYSSIPNNLNKNTYQDNIIRKVYTNFGLLSPFDVLELSMTHFSRQSFVILLNYIIEHVPNIVKNLQNPINYSSNNYLVHGNNSMYQLNLVNNSDYNNVKYNSVIDVIDNTFTAIGKRYLNYNILNPLIDANKINQRYEHIELLLKNNFYKKIQDNLQYIADIEKLHRKISIAYLNPSDLVSLNYSYSFIKRVINLFINEKLDILPSKDTINNLDLFIKKYTDTFNDIENLSQFNTINDIDNNIFKKGLFKNLDELQNSINVGENFLNNLAIELSKFIDDTNNYFQNNNQLHIKIESNDRDGYYLSTTKIKANKIKNALKNIKDIKIGNINVNTSTISFKDNTGKASITKIIIPEIKTVSDKLIDTKNEMKLLIKDKYTQLLLDWYNNYSNLFFNIVEYIGYVDFIANGAFISQKLNYCKPTITQKNNSFIDVKQLRHPIIEQINNNNYIPHDIKLGVDNLNGILLYGLNSSGKSSLSKAVGISVVLAQIGYYVPAKSFNYSPFHNIFTRIAANDNLFKGLSSFSLEMVELQAILRRCGPNSLVLADELCKGTEVQSANIIVLAMIETLSKSNTCFISATHLHEIYNYPRFKNLTNIKCFHLHVEYDEINDNLIYTRNLLEGAGPSFYGLAVARYLIHDKHFIDLTKQIQNDIKLPVKTSKYNNNLIVEKCAICSHQPMINELPLETHHIKEQHNADNNGFINHMHKNNKSNLVVLCNKCHDMVERPIDNKMIIINGYKDTSNGLLLDWKYIDCNNINDKLIDSNDDLSNDSNGDLSNDSNSDSNSDSNNDKEININNVIIELKNKKMTQRKIQEYIKLHYDIKISIPKISKIYNN